MTAAPRVKGIFGVLKTRHQQEIHLERGEGDLALRTRAIAVESLA